MILVFLLILYIHVDCVDCFSGAWRVFICSRWNGLSSCWILGRSSQYWSLYINHHIIFYIQHCDCFDIAVERYCPRTNEWQTVAPMHESRSPKILLILYHFFQSHCLFCYLCMNHQLPSPPSSYSSSFDRFGCAVVAHQGRIYVSGGFGQDKVNFSLVSISRLS